MKLKVNKRLMRVAQTQYEVQQLLSLLREDMGRDFQFDIEKLEAKCPEQYELYKAGVYLTYDDFRKSL